jgi:hypothetical protein
MNEIIVRLLPTLSDKPTRFLGRCPAMNASGVGNRAIMLYAYSTVEIAPRATRAIGLLSHSRGVPLTAGNGDGSPGPG